jgi:hypothetical protein
VTQRSKMNYNLRRKEQFGSQRYFRTTRVLVLWNPLCFLFELIETYVINVITNYIIWHSNTIVSEKKNFFSG